jgi:hypothetical protein
MAIIPATVSPYRSVDASGRALPMTVEEIRARTEEVAQGPGRPRRDGRRRGATADP